MTSIFICAAWSWAETVRAMHAEFASHGFDCLSQWAYGATGPTEGLDRYSVERLREFREVNYAGIERADVVVFLADSPAREGFLEVAKAITDGKRVVWAGRDTLSTACRIWPNVYVVADDRAAVDHVIAMRARAA